MKSFKQYLAEISMGDQSMVSMMSDLDRRAKAREENRLLQTQLDQSIERMNQKDYAGYNIPNMPNLSANIEFSSQSRARSGSGIATPQSELDAFNTLGQDRQQMVAQGLPTSTLERMQQAQYDRSQGILSNAPGSRMAPRLNAGSVAAQNTISGALENRRGPMGGRAGVQSYVDRLNRNSSAQVTGDQTMTPAQRMAGRVNPVVGAVNKARQGAAQTSQADTQTALAGKSYQELSAMRDALDTEIKAGFASGNKQIDPAKYKTYMAIDRAINATMEK